MLTLRGRRVGVVGMSRRTRTNGNLVSFLPRRPVCCLSICRSASFKEHKPQGPLIIINAVASGIQSLKFKRKRMPSLNLPRKLASANYNRLGRIAAELAQRLRLSNAPPPDRSSGCDLRKGGGVRRYAHRTIPFEEIHRLTKSQDSVTFLAG